MSLFFHKAAVAGLLLVFILCSGCGKSASTITVSGAVLRNGQPLPLSRNGYVQVTLHPDLPEGTPFTPKFAECDKATGKFQIHQVLPGKYKVGIEQFDPDPTSDKLNGAFRAATSKIIREIDGKEPIVIDLAKPSS
jgi:hypothetical protein